MITVFTPTYNRSYIIRNLYNSLCLQSYSDFEWLIVDDGSTDDTEILINSFINSNKINIRYIKQDNGGKHRALNRGVCEAKGELFFIVDSDDYILENALERIVDQYESIMYKKDFAGLCGLKCFPDGKTVRKCENFNILDCTSLDFRYKYHHSGDMAEVFKTDILRLYPFPDFENENFCAESLIWNRIAQKYKLRYFYENIYICDYLEDGLSFSSVKNRMKSPTYAMCNYAELSKMDIPFCIKLKSYVNFWRFAFCSKWNLITKIKKIGFISICLLPIGFLFHLVDMKR